MPSNLPVEMLQDVPLFQHLTMAEIEELLAASEDREYRTDEVIFHEGAHDRALYVIFDGQVQIVLPTPAFQETVVATLGAGSVFGESTFFHPASHVATARCLADVLAVRLTREKYDRLLSHGSSAAHKLAANAADLLAERLQATDRWIEQILQQEQDAAVAASWRDFRRSIGFTFEPQRWGP